MRDPEDQISFVLFWMVATCLALMISTAFLWVVVSLGVDIFNMLR